ncbi:MAG TPA: MFS transporter [Gaiellaceae bacterium]|nr:MFS transporter [Gaiellaceae bacterium]
MTSRFGPLRRRAYRNVFLARAASSIGDALIFVAFAFAVLRLGGSASQLGLLLALGTVIRLVLLVFAGVYADRMPRQLVMLSSDIVRGAVQGVMALLLITHHATLWQLGLSFAIHSAASAFFGPASDGLTPQLVPSDELQNANALLDLTRSAPSILGPVIAGALVAAFGPGWVFAIDAVSFVVSAFFLSLVRLPPREPREHEPFFQAVAVGWREIRARDWYWQNLITHALWNFAWPMTNVLGPVVALQYLGGAKSWGIVSGAEGVGFVLGSLITLRIKPNRPLVVGNALLVLSAVPCVLLAKPTSTWLIAASVIPAMAGLGILNALWFTVIGLRLPEHVLSRVNSFDWIISLVVNPAGLALAGPLSVAIGTRSTLLIAAAIIAVPSTLICFVPSVRSVTATP